MKPIKPEELESYASNHFPEQVINVFNNLIVENWNGYSAKVLQEDAKQRIMKVLDIHSSEVFAKGYLDIEEMYRSSGWDVEYDKPGYYEWYSAYFYFRKK